MKVGIVMPLGTKLGGGEQMFLDLLEYGQNSSIEWVAICLKDGPIVEQAQALGIKIKKVNVGRLREIHKFIPAIFHIINIIRNEEIDLIVSWMWISHLYGGIPALFLGKKALWYELDHSGSHSSLRNVVTAIPAMGVITLSKTDYLQQKIISPSKKVSLVYPGVNLENFNRINLSTPQETRRKLGLPMDRPIIGIVGRMQRWKGIHTVIKSMPKILEKIPDVHCVIIGGRDPNELDYFDEVQHIVQDLKLEDSVHLVGQQKNIAEWMQAMDIVIHASDNEPFGIVIIEAMALGKPIIAGANGGPTEIVTHGVNGLLVEYDNNEALAQAILRYLENPELSRKMGKMAEKRAQDFSSQKYAENFISVLKKMYGHKSIFSL